MAENTMTDFERAKLKLLAFQALDLWGTRDDDGEHTAWNLKERKQKAEELFDWMTSSAPMTVTDQFPQPPLVNQNINEAEAAGIRVVQVGGE